LGGCAGQIAAIAALLTDLYPHEWLVGNFTSKRVGGNLWVEYFATTTDEDALTRTL
jgi:hypothetical protein